MAQSRNYSRLLEDIDDAPAIYETPELTDDNSTVPASTAARTPSLSSDTEQSEDDASGVVRRRLRANEARSHFLTSRVDARGVDFSDTVNGARRSYYTSSRRRRRDGGEELGDLSDEEDEGLERKLARLRREVEEVKQEFEQRKHQTDAEDAGSEHGSDGEDPTAEITRMSDQLDAVYIQRHHGGVQGAEAQFIRTLKRWTKAAGTQASQPEAATSAPPIPDGLPAPRPATLHPPSHHQHILSKAADFDARLTALEQALGLTGTYMPDTGSAPQKPILPALDALTSQLAALSTASPDALDALSRRVRAAARDAERLDSLRRAGGSHEPAPAAAARGTPSKAPRPGQTNGTAATTTTASSPSSAAAAAASAAADDDASPASPADAARAAKIDALYSTLRTIDALAPTLPPVLERLRGLRLVHAAAAGAGQRLAALETHAAEQAAEIARWRAALGRTEAAVGEGERVAAANVTAVGEWVRGLEGRVAGVGG